MSGSGSVCPCVAVAVAVAPTQSSSPLDGKPMIYPTIYIGLQKLRE